MIIEIPDDVEDKLEYAKVELIKASLKMNKTHRGTARFLGCSYRVFANWFKKYPELLSLRNSGHNIVSLTGNEKWDMYPDN